MTEASRRRSVAEKMRQEQTLWTKAPAGISECDANRVVVGSVKRPSETSHTAGEVQLRAARVSPRPGVSKFRAPIEDLLRGRSIEAIAAPASTEPAGVTASLAVGRRGQRNSSRRRVTGHKRVQNAEQRASLLSPSPPACSCRASPPGPRVPRQDRQRAERSRNKPKSAVSGGRPSGRVRSACLYKAGARTEAVGDPT